MMEQQNNVVNLSGIVVSDQPDQRHTDMSKRDLATQVLDQVAGLHVEVDWVHEYHSHMATLSNTTGEAIHMHSAVLMRQFDNRLCELDSLICALHKKLSEENEH